MRAEWLTAVATQVLRVEQDNGDALDPVPLEAAQRLAEVLGDDEADLQAWHLLGRFHMHRDAAIYHAGDDGWQADNEAMLGAFARRLLAGPDRREGLDVPAEILGVVAEHAGRKLLGFETRAAASEDPEAVAVAEAPLMWQRIISRLPTDDPARPRILARMCTALLERFQATGDVADLDAAVTVAREAVTMGVVDPSLPARHFGLGLALAVRFDHRGARADIDGAVAALQRALETSPAVDSSRTGYLSVYGNALRTRFEHWGERNDLDGAITAMRLAVSGAEDEARPGLLRSTAAVLVRRFDETASSADLDEAIAAFRQVLDQMPTDDPTRSDCLSGLGSALRIRFGVTRDTRDLDGAVSLGRQAVTGARRTDPGRPVFQSNLGVALMLHAIFSGDPEELEEAVVVCREAVAALGPEHRLRATFVSNLSAALLTGATTGANVAEAIALAREAVALTPPGHPDRGRFLMNLCNALLDRLDQHDDPAEADEAVEVAHRMLDAFPHGHANRANALQVLGSALRRRAALSGEVADFDEAVGVIEEAMTVLPPGPARTEVGLDLGVTLRRRFRRSGSAEDLDRAVAVFREFADEPGTDAAADGWAQYDLGATLLLRYERLADTEDLTCALAALRRALARPGIDAEDRAQVGSKLSGALRLVFGLTGRKAEIDEAVELARQAVDSAPPGHPSLSVYQLVLGKALEARAQLQIAYTPVISGASQEVDPAAQAEMAEISAQLAALVDIDTSEQLPSILVPGALDGAQRLADQVAADAEPDVDTHALLGRYYWLRYLALTTDRQHAENVRGEGRSGDRESAGEEHDIATNSSRFALTAAIDFYTLPFAAGRSVPQRLRLFVAEDTAAAALADLYGRVLSSGDITELTTAIGLWRRVLDAVPDDHADRSVYSGALGTALQARYAVVGDRTDLHECLTALRGTVAGTADDHPLLPAFQAVLSGALQVGSGLAEDRKERDGALDQAVAMAVQGSMRRSPRRRRRIRSGR